MKPRIVDTKFGSITIEGHVAEHIGAKIVLQSREWER